MSLRKVKRIWKRIEYYERKIKKFKYYFSKVKTWRKSEIKLYNKKVKKLSKEDFDKFYEWCKND